MSEHSGNPAGRLVRWLARRPGYMLLTASDEALAAEPPQRFAHAWVGLILTSLVFGLLLVNLWGLAWRVFRDYEPLVMPATAATMLFCLWPFRRAVAALAAAVGGPDPGGRAVVASALVLTVAGCLLGLKPDWQRWESMPLPAWVGWARPEAKLYRVLLLMPLWGAWAMLIAVKFCRPNGRTEPQVAALAAGCSAPAAAACMAGLLLATIGYFHHLGPGSQAAIFAATMLAAVGGGAALCRKAGGPTRQVLLGGNLLAQFAFILGYLAGR